MDEMIGSAEEGEADAAKMAEKGIRERERILKRPENAEITRDAFRQKRMSPMERVRSYKEHR